MDSPHPHVIIFLEQKVQDFGDEILSGNPLRVLRLYMLQLLPIRGGRDWRRVDLPRSMRALVGSTASPSLSLRQNGIDIRHGRKRESSLHVHLSLLHV